MTRLAQPIHESPPYVGASGLGPAHPDEHRDKRKAYDDVKRLHCGPSSFIRVATASCLRCSGVVGKKLAPSTGAERVLHVTRDTVDRAR